MIIKITVHGGVVQEVETSAPALVQIVDVDAQEISTFTTVAQPVTLEPDDTTPDDPAAEALLNHEVINAPRSYSEDK